ncbi:MAG: hypothetical protein OHK0029_02330 [Armatimonadaceae bacterium]
MNWRRPLTSFGIGVACWLTLLTPLVLFVLLIGVPATIGYLDKVLSRAAPIAEYEASRILERPIRIGTLDPRLDVQTLWQMFRNPETAGTVAVVITDITIGNRPDEARLAGRPLLGSAERVTAYISVIELLQGEATNAVKRIVVESPELIAVRDPQGEWNLTKIAPEPEEDKEPEVPFRTVVEIQNAVVVWRDYASFRPQAERPVSNAFLIPTATVDLSGMRTIRFTANARARPGSVTTQRLRGYARVTGTLPRGESGALPESPSENAPGLLIRADATGVNIPYWAYYFVDSMEGIRLESGFADAVVSLAQPPKPLFSAPQAEKDREDPPPMVLARVRFREGAVRVNALNETLTNLGGTLEYNDGGVQFAVEGQAYGEPVQANGAVWDLLPPAASPQIAAEVNASRLPVARLVRAFAPQGALPRDLGIGGAISASATISGPITEPTQLAIAGKVQGAAVSYTGFPAVRGIQSDVYLANGVLQARNLRATVQGGGAIRGEAVVEIPEGDGQTPSVVFAVEGNNLNLNGISALKPVTGNDNRDLRLRGRGNVVATGRVVDGQVFAAADVRASGLQLGETRFPVARARVLVNNGQIVIPAARIESTLGVVSVTGDVTSQGRLDLRWAARGVDLGKLARKFGVRDASGLVSGYGSIDGTAENPRLRVADLVALNLRYTLPPAEGQQTSERRLAADVLRLTDVLATPERIVIPNDSPLIVRRYPASITVSGTVSELALGKVAPAVEGASPPAFNPRLNLAVRVENLDYEEVQEQLGLASTAAVDLPTDTDIEAEQTASFSGQVLRSGIRVTGRLDSPNVSGTAVIGKMLVGNFLLEGGSVTFSYSEAGTRLTGIVVSVRSDIIPGAAPQTSAIKGSVTIAADGDIDGEFRTGTFSNNVELNDTVDISRLSYLTGGNVTFRGNAALQGTVSGNIEQPNVVVQLSVPELAVAGIPLRNIAAEIRYSVPEGREQGVVALTNLQIDQRGGAAGELPPAPDGKPANPRIAIERASYDLQSGQVALAGDIQIPSIQQLINTLRGSELATFEAGERIIRALGQFPEEIRGAIALNNLSLRATVQDGKVQNPQVSGTLLASNLRIGEFATDSLTVQAQLDDDEITVGSLIATNQNPAYTILGSGTYDPEGNVRAVLESNNFPLESLRTLPRLNGFPLIGTIAFSVFVEGDSDRPTITASVDGENLLLLTGEARQNIGAVGERVAPQGVRFSSVSILGSVGEVTPEDANRDPNDEIGADEIGKYRILFPRIRVTRNAAVFDSYVSIPFSFSENGDDLATRPLAVNLEVPPLNLNAFADLLDIETVPLEQDPVEMAERERTTKLAAPVREPELESIVKEGAVDPSGEIGGRFGARVRLAGTLRQPLLSGYVVVNDGRFRPAREPISDRDRISPVRDLDLTIRLIGDHICFDENSYENYRQAFAQSAGIAPEQLTINPPEGLVFTPQTVLSLGGINGKKGDFGTLTLGGSVTLANLSNLQRYLQQGEGTATESTLTGEYDLTAAFKDFQIAAENVLANAPDANKGEALETRLNGTLRFTGNQLTKPNIATPDGQPLRIGGLKFRLPGFAEEQEGEFRPAPIEPSFNIALSIEDKATLYNATFFRFEVGGDLSLRGPLYRDLSAFRTPQGDYNLQGQSPFGFALQGDLETQGGNIFFPTLPPFTVQKRGLITIQYGNFANPGVQIDADNPIIARSRPIAGRFQESFAGAGGTERDPFALVTSAESSVDIPSERYVITVILSGRLNLAAEEVNLGPNSVTNRQISGLRLEFESDPPLTDQQILALILPIQQLELAREGRVEDALRSFTTQALTASLLPGQISRITDSIATSLGLEDLSVDYDPDAPLRVRFLKRLSPPFDRFIFDFTRTFQTRNQPNQLQPFEFGLSYEVFQFRRRRGGIVPRLQVGFNTDEQRVTTYFLRGTINY